MPSRQTCCSPGVEPRLFARHFRKNPPPAFSPPELALNDSPLCVVWICAIFARVVFLPQVPRDPVHHATGTAAVVIPPTLWLRLRCSRSLSFAPPPPVENARNTFSLPLAVPFCKVCLLLLSHFWGSLHPYRAMSES